MFDGFLYYLPLFMLFLHMIAGLFRFTLKKENHEKKRVFIVVHIPTFLIFLVYCILIPDKSSFLVPWSLLLVHLILIAINQFRKPKKGEE